MKNEWLFSAREGTQEEMQGEIVSGGTEMMPECLYLMFQLHRDLFKLYLCICCYNVCVCVCGLRRHCACVTHNCEVPSDKAKKVN